MQLGEMMQGIEIRLLAGELNQDIKGISYDSRKVKPGDLFVCIKGLKSDGHEYIGQALNRGAVALLVEREIAVDTKVVVLLTGDSRRALPMAAANFFGHPSQQVKVVGVTGTNGKTTTTHLIQAILEELGARTAIMGTLYARIGDQQIIMGHTTPEALEIQDFMHLVQSEKGDYLIMEVSSHALDLGRVDQIHFHAAVFTNLTQDHLDYHVSMDKYKQAKLRLFSALAREAGAFAVINADDPAAGDFVQASGAKYCLYGVNQEADVKAIQLHSSLKGSQFTVVHGTDTFDINMKLIGRFNVYNALAAIAFALCEGVDKTIIKSALEKIKGVPGRFELVDCGQDFTVVVDYAHTPDGLENILRTGREILENRLITVFGCGGDRDKSKRPLMGKIAAQYSDFCIVTSDNPRSEDPEAIIDDIIPGLKAVENSYYAKIIDRREAIHQAICLAKKGDLVVIAGKGHETYQLINDQVLEFDDRLVAAEFLRGRMEE
ncbi:MAG: UDP-N-acetylmuramoyl-L-alanyl-D-glutamate--2,6-diaminopimelate ligase [Firmicutes bacterium]|nr:UDP-N-acetylmuramoyl-L-alanyl-D-glutamate--2,6-diaminopimelate ligase [Bacillota bacterium]